MSGFSKTKQSRRQFLIKSSLAGTAVGLGGVGLTACGGGTGTRSGAPQGREGTAGETLFITGFQWSAITHFNPYGQSAAWPAADDVMQLLYESVLRYNLLTGELEPGLATELQEPDPYTFVLPIQPNAKWSDGKPLTAHDVVYTYTLPQRYPELDATLWDYVDSVVATDDRTVTIKLKQEPYNPLIVKAVLTRDATAWILPEHIWSKYEADKSKTIGEHTNENPVGSGPYTIESYDQSQIRLVRNDNYWGKAVFGGLPVPKYIVHPIFKDNAAAALAFEQGEVDVAQIFTAEIWKMWEEKDLPVGTWFNKEPYHLPGNIPLLAINCQEKGLDDPRVRRALAYAIDYADIAAKAMSRYSTPAKSSVVVPDGAEAKFFDQPNVDKNGWKYDLAESQRILEQEVGATKGDDGIYVLPDGTRLGPWTVQTPNGWTDWMAAARIVANNAKKAGFDISTEFPDEAAVTDAVNSGNFKFAVWDVTGASPASPWQRLRDILDIRGVPERGKRAFWNFGRFSNPDVPALLDSLAAAKNDEEAKAYVTQLDTIFMQNAPMIPLMNRPDEFFEFHETNWTNFPTAENPYAVPGFRGAGINWLYKIKRI